MSTTSSTMRARSLDMHVSRWRAGGPEHGHGGPFVQRASKLDPPSVVANDPCGDREPEPGPFTTRLGREEWIEDALQVGRRNSTTMVDNLDQNHIVRCRTGGKSHAPAGRGGIAGVEQ